MDYELIDELVRYYAERARFSREGESAYVKYLLKLYNRLSVAGWNVDFRKLKELYDRYYFDGFEV